MKIAITAQGDDLDFEVNPFFGRAPCFVFVDPETLAFDAVVNPALMSAGGAGIRAAQLVIEHQVAAVLTGNVGPNAYGVLRAADVPIYLVGSCTVRQAVDQFKAGEVEPLQQASAQSHAGMGGQRLQGSRSRGNPRRG
jgi:predicted Fe-Mo cluster-binding NifX family protein